MEWDDPRGGPLWPDAFLGTAPSPRSLFSNHSPVHSGAPPAPPPSLLRPEPAGFRSHRAGLRGELWGDLLFWRHLDTLLSASPPNKPLLANLDSVVGLFLGSLAPLSLEVLCVTFLFWVREGGRSRVSLGPAVPSSPHSPPSGQLCLQCEGSRDMTQALRSTYSAPALATRGRGGRQPLPCERDSRRCTLGDVMLRNGRRPFKQRAALRRPELAGKSGTCVHRHPGRALV